MVSFASLLYDRFKEVVDFSMEKRRWPWAIGTNGDRAFIILSWVRAVRRDMILEVVGRLLTFDFRALYCYSRRMPD